MRPPPPDIPVEPTVPLTVRAFERSDYPAVRALWEATPGVGLNESDIEEAIASFLLRNPQMSAVATRGAMIVGAVLCGHDGRRGYLHHLAVAESHRRQGIARALLDWCLQHLIAEGILKCNIFLYTDNAGGAAFWRHNGWSSRADLAILQKPLLPNSPGSGWRPGHPAPGSDEANRPPAANPLNPES